MFTVKDGKIVITGVAAHVSQVYTPEEWNAEMLRLLNDRQVALNNKAIVKINREQVAFPQRPELPTIWGYMLWRSETDKAIEVANTKAALLEKLNAEIKALEAQIIRLMPENFKMYIVDDEKPGAYSVWWTRGYDSEGTQQNTLRVETLKHAPRIVPMSQQIDGDDLESAPESDNAFGYDDEEEIGGVPSEYSGENDEPPARVNPVSQQIDGDDLESDLDWDIETDEDGLEVEYEDEDTVDEYGDDDISF